MIPRVAAGHLHLVVCLPQRGLAVGAQKRPVLRLRPLRLNSRLGDCSPGQGARSGIPQLSFIRVLCLVEAVLPSGRLPCDGLGRADAFRLGAIANVRA